MCLPSCLRPERECAPRAHAATLEAQQIGWILAGRMADFLKAKPASKQLRQINTQTCHSRRIRGLAKIGGEHRGLHPHVSNLGRNAGHTDCRAANGSCEDEATLEEYSFAGNFGLNCRRHLEEVCLRMRHQYLSQSMSLREPHERHRFFRREVTGAQNSVRAPHQFNHVMNCWSELAFICENRQAACCAPVGT